MPRDRAGSVYEAGVVRRLCEKVYTIELLASLEMQAEERFKQLQYFNISVKLGDRWSRWPDDTLYEAILITAALPHVSQPLLDQLTLYGRPIAPLGKDRPRPDLFDENRDSFQKDVLGPRFFCPLPTISKCRRGAA